MEEARVVDRSKDTRGAGWVLPLASTVTFLGFIDTHMLVPILALYASALGANVGTVGLIVGLYSLVNTPGNVFFGRLMDKLGRKGPLVVGLVCDSFCMFAYSLCRGPGPLLLVRALHGAGGAVVGPATLSLMADHAAGERRGGTMAYYGMAIGLSVLMGYGLGGFAVSRVGYDLLFYVGAALLLAGAGLALLTPGSLAIAPNSTRTSIRQDLAKLAELLRRKRLAACYYAIFAQFFTFGSVVTLLPLYARDLGLGAMHVAILLLTAVMAFVALQLPGGSLSDRLGRRLPACLGLALASIAVGALFLLSSFEAMALAMAVFGVEWGLLFPSISALLADDTLPSDRGMASGIFHALLTGGVALGAPAMALVAGVMGIGQALSLSAVATAAGVFIVLALAGTRAQHDEEARG